MDLQLTEAEQGFRERARAWLETVDRPLGLRDYGGTPTLADLDAARTWQQMLFEAGYAGLSWPRSFGGAEASVIERATWAEETARAGVPAQLNLVGLELVGPMVIEFGTKTQQERLLPPLLCGHQVWCQLFSEPEAGSDLAGLQTRAVPSDEGWRIYGQKVWTSGAHYSDFGLLLARTDSEAARHRGITCFVLPMDRPGIDIRPLKQMDGLEKFNEVYFDDVPVTPADVLGSVGGGWQVAVSTLGRERLVIGANAVRFSQLLEALWEELARQGLDGNPLLRQRWSALWRRIQLLRLLWYQMLSIIDDYQDPRLSLLKLVGTELERDLTIFSQDVLGQDLLAGRHGKPWRERLLAAPGQTIAGGTSEIQRNILARRVLRLPEQ